MVLDEREVRRAQHHQWGDQLPFPHRSDRSRNADDRADASNDNLRLARDYEVTNPCARAFPNAACSAHGAGTVIMRFESDS
jgi:hypothetical protein